MKKQNYKNNDADSLKRSHSAKSNFKLTMLCLLSSLALCVCVCALAFINKFDKSVMIPVIIGSGALFVVTCTWFSAFTR